MDRTSDNNHSCWTIDRKTIKGMIDHALACYPSEACGILLLDPHFPMHIREIYPTKNITTENPQKRYKIDPLEFLAADQWADQKGMEIGGFYHSHPDYPSTPSEYDRQLAQEGYLYLILSIKKGASAQTQAWLYDPEDRQFKEVGLKPGP